MSAALQELASRLRAGGGLVVATGSRLLLLDGDPAAAGEPPT